MKSLFTFLALLWLSITYSQDAFITTWKTDNPGVSEDNQITIPTFPGETYNYSVDWGDGTTDTNIIGNITHTYTIPGTFQVEISGVFPRVYFHNEGDKEKILSVDQWGIINWSSMENAFSGCANLDVNTMDTPMLSNVSDIRYMFYGCTSLVGTNSFNNWDTSNVTRMDSLFAACSLFNQPIGNWNLENVTTIAGLFNGATSFNQDIGNWNVSNVEDMTFTFAQASSFDQYIGDWDVSKVFAMGFMFNGASAFNQNIGNWNVGNVVHMYSMFSGATLFNQPIGNWDTSNVTSTSGMFGAAQAFNQPIGNWNMFNVTNMSSMFSGATNFNQDISNWDVSSVTKMPGMFRYAQVFNQPIGNWNISSITDMSRMFEGALNFNQNLGLWNITSVGTMEDMFLFAGISQSNYDSTLTGWSSKSSLQNNIKFNGGSSTFCAGEGARLKLINQYGWEIIDGGKANCPFITTWKTDNPGLSDDNQITIPTFPGETYNYYVDWGDGTSDTNINGDITHTYEVPGTYQVSIDGTFPRIYFYGNHNPGSNDVLKILSVNQWGTITWTSFESAFEGCSNLDVLAQDIPNLSLVSSLKLMFDSCANLVGNSSINNWDVSNVSNMHGVFANALIFNQSINGWDTSSVTTTSGMFFKARSFNQPLNSWDVSNVEDMSVMYGSADKFNQPLVLWNTTSTKNMNGMFEYAIEFNQPLDSWNVSNVENMQSMFLGARSFNQPLNSWNVSKVSNMYGMFQEADKFNQPLNSWNVSNVENMSSMFWNATSFNQNITDWNVSNVTSMNSTFKNAISFNQDLSNWNIVNVSSMYEMFSATSVTTEIYDKTLIGWSNLSTLKNNVLFDGGNSQYCESEEARQYLIDTYGWTITDGGKSLLCNEDNDFDGVLDHKDNCLNTVPNATVDETGCEIIPGNAILVYGLTPTCPGTTNGSIQVSSSLTDPSYNISLDGPTTITENNVSLNQPYIINNLSTGLYTVEISIPEASYTQSFGIQINEVGSISGKRENLDLKSKSVSYSVQGSHSYKVNINNKETLFNFDSAGPNQIQLNDLNGFNTISISGESDCQGLIEDSFNFSDSVVMYPVNTTDKTFIEGYDEESEVQIFDISGRLLFQKKLQKDKLESIDLESYDSGIYPVKIISNKNTQTFKIIKQ